MAENNELGVPTATEKEGTQVVELTQEEVSEEREVQADSEGKEEEKVSEGPGDGEEAESEDKVTDGIYQDRREYKRWTIKLNKVFSGKVGEGLDVMPIYIYIIDISLGGMRITTDFDLPVRDPFHMAIKLDDPTPLDVDVEIRWKKEMFGGTYMMGIQFYELTGEEQHVIKNFMERHSAESKRKAYRLDRVLAVEMTVEGVEDKFHTLTMDLSPHGMRITNPFPLPYDKLVTLKMMLDFEDKPVIMKSRVRWQSKTSYDRYMLGLEFTNITGDDARRINRYIDRAISGELDDKVFKELPMEVFETTIKRYDEMGRRGDYIG